MLQKQLFLFQIVLFICLLFVVNDYKVMAMSNSNKEEIILKNNNINEEKNNDENSIGTKPNYFIKLFIEKIIIQITFIKIEIK